MPIYTEQYYDGGSQRVPRPTRERRHSKVVRGPDHMTRLCGQQDDVGGPPTFFTFHKAARYSRAHYVGASLTSVAGPEVALHAASVRIRIHAPEGAAHMNDIRTRGGLRSMS